MIGTGHTLTQRRFSCTLERSAVAAKTSPCATDLHKTSIDVTPSQPHCNRSAKKKIILLWTIIPTGRSDIRPMFFVVLDLVGVLAGLRGFAMHAMFCSPAPLAFHQTTHWICKTCCASIQHKVLNLVKGFGIAGRGAVVLLGKAAALDFFADYQMPLAFFKIASTRRDSKFFNSLWSRCRRCEDLVGMYGVPAMLCCCRVQRSKRRSHQDSNQGCRKNF